MFTRCNLFVLLTGFVLLFSARAEAAAPDVQGYWYTQGREAGVQLYACDVAADGKICGRFFWIGKDDNTNQNRDSLNPDPTKREQPLCHLQFMGNFTPDGQGHYKDGWIYSPRDGQTFSADLTLVDHDTLDLHGYLWLPALGENQTWKRAASLPPCTAG